MPDLKNIIHYHAGQNGKHSYFHINGGGVSKRAARVSMNTMRKINLAILHRREIGLPISNLAEFLATFLPVEFLIQLKRTGIGMVEAWEYMAGQALAIPTQPTPRSRRRKTECDHQINQLARVLAVVSGGKKTPKELALVLKDLVQAHLPQALALLQQWIDEYGYTSKGGYPRIANRSNRAAKNGSTKGSAKGA